MTIQFQVNVRRGQVSSRTGGFGASLRRSALGGPVPTTHQSHPTLCSIPLPSFPPLRRENQLRGLEQRWVRGTVSVFSGLSSVQCIVTILYASLHLCDESLTIC